jgi:hypothetical protein
MIESRIRVEDLPSWVFFPDKASSKKTFSVLFLFFKIYSFVADQAQICCPLLEAASQTIVAFTAMPGANPTTFKFTATTPAL